MNVLNTFLDNWKQARPPIASVASKSILRWCFHTCFLVHSRPPSLMEVAASLEARHGLRLVEAGSLKGPGHCPYQAEPGAASNSLTGLDRKFDMRHTDVVRMSFEGFLHFTFIEVTASLEAVPG